MSNKLSHLWGHTNFQTLTVIPPNIVEAATKDKDFPNPQGAEKKTSYRFNVEVE
jgi:hypothetical protein